jgi:hypothetical protein
MGTDENYVGSLALRMKFSRLDDVKPLSPKAFLVFARRQTVKIPEPIHDIDLRCLQLRDSRWIELRIR